MIVLWGMRGHGLNMFWHTYSTEYRIHLYQLERVLFKLQHKCLWNASY